MQRSLSEESKLKLSAELLQWLKKEKDNLDIKVFKTVAEISQSFKGGEAEDSAVTIAAPRPEASSLQATSRFSLFKKRNAIPEESLSAEEFFMEEMAPELMKEKLISQITRNLQALNIASSSVTPSSAVASTVGSSLSARGGNDVVR